jgi:ribose 5-phosphate isomerase
MTLPNPRALVALLQMTVGVLKTGLFLGMASCVIVVASG